MRAACRPKTINAPFRARRPTMTKPGRFRGLVPLARCVCAVRAAAVSPPLSLRDWRS